MNTLSGDPVQLVNAITSYVCPFYTVNCRYKWRWSTILALSKSPCRWRWTARTVLGLPYLLQRDACPAIASFSLFPAPARCRESGAAVYALKRVCKWARCSPSSWKRRNSVSEWLFSTQTWTASVFRRQRVVSPSVPFLTTRLPTNTCCISLIRILT